MSTQINLQAEIEKLRDDARLTRRAHFRASERKKHWFRTIGVTVIILNAFIASGLADVAATSLQWTPNAFIKAVAVVIGSLIGVQTFLPLSKEYELHLAAGETYASVYRHLKLLIARIKDGADIETVRPEFDAQLDKYLAANERYKNSVPTKKDFDTVASELRQLPIQSSPST